MNKGHRRIIGFAIAAIFALVIGLSITSTITGACDSKASGSRACGDKEEVKATSAQASSCNATHTRSVSTDGCGVKAGSAAGGCASTCASMKQASVVMPEDVQMKSVEVEGGVDMVFTSADLAAVESFIRARLNGCTNNANGKACGLKAEVVTAEQSVTLSIRGEYPEGCCAGSFMDKSEEAGESSGESVKST